MADISAMPVAMRAPFRPFFLAAALDAAFGAIPWLAHTEHLGISAAEWHRAALLFGALPAMIAGFLLTALPRWSGAPGPPAPIVLTLVALWLSARASYFVLSPAAGLAVTALFVASLIACVAPPVLASPKRRNRKVLLILILFAAAAAATATPGLGELGVRMAIASIVGLLIVIGGRVTPALASAYAGTPAVPPLIPLERCAATAATLALGAWIVAPGWPFTGLAAATAALVQALRAAQWRGWRARSPAVLALHAGYGWIVVGFALLAIHAFAPARLGPAAAVHTWMIGAAGTMGLAIMASMIRRHSGLAFARSTALTMAFAAVTASCLSRLVPEFSAWPPDIWTAMTAAGWTVGFVLFLVAFRRPLLGRV